MIASFGDKTFVVTRKRVYTFKDFTWSSKLKTEKQDTAGKKPTSTIKGPDLNTIKITLILNRMLSVNPRKELEDWERIKDAAVPNPFILGSRAMGLNKYLVIDCGLSNVIIDKNGDINAAELSLTFEEYLPGGKQIKSGATTGKASGIASATGKATGGATKASGISAKNAYSVVTPTAQEKSQLKRNNAGM